MIQNTTKRALRAGGPQLHAAKAGGKATETLQHPSSGGRPVVGVHRSEGAGQSKAGAAHEASRLKIATYNVLFKTTHEQTKHDLTRLMEHTGVITLQEFDTRHRGLYPWVKSKGWGHFQPKHGGEPVIWDKRKYERVDAGATKLNDPVKGLGTRPGVYPAHHATWVQLRDKRTGKVFTTVSVHTIAHNKGERLTPRTNHVARQQFRVLAELSDKLQKHGPVIIGGDLNTGPDHKKTYPRDILESADLRSNWDWLGEQGVGPGTHSGHFIDNFLTLTDEQKHLKLRSHRIVYGLHSDHNAVIARYRLR